MDDMRKIKENTILGYDVKMTQFFSFDKFWGYFATLDDVIWSILTNIWVFHQTTLPCLIVGGSFTEVRHFGKKS